MQVRHPRGARARAGAGVTPPLAGAVEPAGPRVCRDLRLDVRPGDARPGVLGEDDDGGLPGTGAEHVELPPTDGQGGSGARAPGEQGTVGDAARNPRQGSLGVRDHQREGPRQPAGPRRRRGRPGCGDRRDSGACAVARRAGPLSVWRHSGADGGVGELAQCGRPVDRGRG